MQFDERKYEEIKRNNKRAVVLLSGGLDSTTTLAIALDQGYDVTALSFDYGQRHKKELENGGRIARYYDIDRKVFKIDLTQIGGSALTDGSIQVPRRKLEEIVDIPNTFVPSRNMIFLSIASSYAYVNNIDNIFIGVNAIDYSGYPDCRPEFISMQDSINKALLKDIKIHAPLIDLGKKEIVELGMRLKAPLYLTHSCYEGREKACGMCDSCQLRLKGFMEAGIPDPVEYEKYPDWYEEWYEEYLRKTEKRFNIKGESNEGKDSR